MFIRKIVARIRCGLIVLIKWKSVTMAIVKPKTSTSVTQPDVSSWVLYLLECENGAYYAGITTDLDRRFAQHVFGIGARYTRANPPKCIVAIMEFPDRASASRAEAALKQLPRSAKPGYFTNRAVKVRKL